MTAYKRIASSPDEATIDLTPMLDVVFILLIFFIITAAFVREVTIDIQRPENRPPTTKHSPSLVVEVDDQNRFAIDGRSVDRRSLRAYIERYHAKNRDAAVIINAHKQSQAGAIVRVADAARSAGVFTISIAP